MHGVIYTLQRLLTPDLALPLQSDDPASRRPTFPRFLEDKSLDPHQLERNRSKKNDRKKYESHVSPESSFLERGHAPEANTDIVERRDGTKEDDSFEQETTSHIGDSRKRKRSPTPSTAVRSPSRERPKETFERRPRHKTKEDRYEPKKKTEKERKSNRKKPKKGELTKGTKKAGETLMHNFTSKHVGNDRLTASILRLSRSP